MAVAYKSSGAYVSQATGTSLALPVPALAASDYVVAVILCLASGTVTAPAGWAEVTPSPIFSEPAVTPTLFYHVFWKRVASSASATSETFTTPSGSSAGKTTVLTGAANSAPATVGVNNGTPAAYWQTPTMTVGGFYIGHALLFASRAPSGSFTTSGTTVPTGTFTALTADTPLAAGFTGFRYQTASFNVTNTPNGNVRTGLSGGSATSDVILMLIPLDSGDVTDPTVTITSPSEDDTISGTINLTATLSDDTGVTSATATLEDSTNLGSILSGTLSVDTTLISNGAHTITVTAFDAAGNSGSDFVDVTVDNSAGNELSYYDGTTETVLDDTQCRYWDGQNEYGFWYPASGPANELSYYDGSAEKTFAFGSTPHTNPLAGLSYAAYGDSYGVAQVESGVDYTSSDLFPQHLASYLGTTVTNRHVNSYMAMDVAYLMNLGSSGSKWVPGSFDFVTLHVGGNDMKLYASATGLACHKNGVEAMLSLLRMASRVNASSATAGGTWSSVTTGSSGNARSATNPGNTLTFSVSGPNATVFALANRDESGAAFTVAVDGGSPVAATTLAQATANPVVSGTYGLVPVQLLGMGAGSHSVVVTHAGTSGQTLVIDSIGVWDTDPDNVPYVLVVASQKVPLAIAEIALPGPSYPSDMDYQGYKNRVHDAIAKLQPVLGKIAQVLPDSYERVYWDNYMTSPTMFVSDGYHPNLKGMGFLHEVWEGNADRAFS